MRVRDFRKALLRLVPIHLERKKVLPQVDMGDARISNEGLEGYLAYTREDDGTVKATTMVLASRTCCAYHLNWMALHETIHGMGFVNEADVPDALVDYYMKSNPRAEVALALVASALKLQMYCEKHTPRR